MYAFPENQRLMPDGSPLNFGNLGDNIITPQEMYALMSTLTESVFIFAQQLKDTKQCCTVNVFIVGSPETFKIFKQNNNIRIRKPYSTTVQIILLKGVNI